MKKIKNINELIVMVEDFYENDELEWKPYCKIRNALIDLKEINNVG